MPNPWSKAKLARGLSRLASGFRSKRAGSLPVQTGFPTSLADLVVKNRTRLKKRRKPSSPDLGPAAPAPPRDSVSGSVSALRSPSDGGGGPVAVRSTAAVNGEGTRRGSGLGFRMVIVLLVGLAIGGKRLVMGITASAFGLWLLELSGVRVLAFLKPCEDAEKNLSCMIERLDLRGRDMAMVSPIREAGDSDGRSDSLESVGKNDFDEGERALEANRDLGSCRILEKRDFDGLESANKVIREAGSMKNIKAKKFFRKVFRKKSRSGEDGKDGKEIGLSSREGDEENSVEGVSCLGTSDSVPSFDVEEPDTIHKAADGIPNLGINEFNAIQENAIENASLDSSNIDVIREDVSGGRLGSSWKLVFFVVVLSGLMGGKVAALMLTVACFLAIKLIDTILRRSKRC